MKTKGFVKGRMAYIPVCNETTGAFVDHAFTDREYKDLLEHGPWYFADNIVYTYATVLGARVRLQLGEIVWARAHGETIVSGGATNRGRVGDIVQRN